jgi:hypothetical protein
MVFKAKEVPFKDSSVHYPNFSFSLGALSIRTMAPFLVLLVSLVFLISYAAGDDPDEFKNPPDASTNVKSASKNPVYNAGDQVEFSWSTSADEVELVIEQQLLEGSDTDDGTPIGSSECRSNIAERPPQLTQ